MDREQKITAIIEPRPSSSMRVSHANVYSSCAGLPHWLSNKFAANLCVRRLPGFFHNRFSFFKAEKKGKFAVPSKRYERLLK